MQDFVQRVREWRSSRIDIWISVRLVWGDTSSSGHGRNGFDVRFRHGDAYDFVQFSWLLCTRRTQDLDKLPPPSAQRCFRSAVSDDRVLGARIYFINRQLRHDISISVHFCKRRKVLEMAVTSRKQCIFSSGILLTKNQDPASRWSF